MFNTIYYANSPPTCRNSDRYQNLGDRVTNCLQGEGRGDEPLATRSEKYTTEIGGRTLGLFEHVLALGEPS